MDWKFVLVLLVPQLTFILFDQYSLIKTWKMIGCDEYDDDGYTVSIICPNINLTKNIFNDRYSSKYQIVNFSGNNLREIDDNFLFSVDDSSLSIENLYLNNCNISKITDGAFKRVQNLNLLDLSFNKLTYVPTINVVIPCDDFNLISMYLHHNPIERVEGISFTGINECLTTLDLSFCKITQIDSDVFTLKYLNVLKLNDNYLKVLSLDPSQVSEYPSFIDLSNNRFDCDCRNYDLMKFIQEITNTKVRRDNTECLYNLTDYFCRPNVTIFKNTKNEIECKSQPRKGTKLIWQEIHDNGSVEQLSSDTSNVKITKNNQPDYQISKLKLLEAKSCQNCRIRCVAQNPLEMIMSNLVFTNTDSEILEIGTVYGTIYNGTLGRWSNFQVNQEAVCINCSLKKIPKIDKQLDSTLISVINLSSNDFHILSDDIFSSQIERDYENNVEYLILETCRITQIENGAFKGMNNLKELNLYDNKLNNVPTGSFEPIKKLEILNLGFNPIYKLSSNAFVTTNSLKSLILSYCRIYTIDNDMFIPIKDLLEELHLEGNDLDNLHFLHLENTLPNLQSPQWQNLSTLDLHSNPLGRIKNDSFLNMPNLHHLKLVSCQISSITLKQNIFYSLTELLSLDLSSNRIQQIRNGTFTSTKNLRELRLDGNKITLIEQSSFNSLTELLILDLSRNYIPRIENGYFASTKNLQELQLRGNQITFIEQNSFNSLTELLNMDLSKNRIQKIEDNFFASMKNLRELKLDGNRISSIEINSFNSLTEIINLDLSHNRIRQIENGHFTSTKNLQELRLQGNLIIFIEQNSFNSLAELLNLDLSGNYIQKIEDNFFASMKNLRELRLNDNNITLIEKNSFISLTELIILDLSENRIQKIENGLFASVKNLRVLRLNDNQIKLISSGAIEGLSKPLIKEINVQNNPLDCSCLNYPIHRWITEQFNNVIGSSTRLDDCLMVTQGRGCKLKITSTTTTFVPSFLQCAADTETGNGEINWFWRDYAMPPQSNSFITSTIVEMNHNSGILTSTLVFTKVGFSCDKCKFRCEATNGVSSDSNVITLLDSESSQNPIGIYVVPIVVRKI